ncbi:MAG: HlyD family secretion protein [Acetobacteraceae bacterium]
MSLNTEATVDRHPAIVIERQVDVSRLKAQLQFTRLNACRFKNLAATGAGSREQGQATAAQLQQLRAQIEGAEAAVKAEEEQTRVLKARHEAALKTLQQDAAHVHQAELNLSYTKIIAPFDGVVGEKTVQNGNYVGPGTALMALVPMNDLWVRANYREIALLHVQPGQKARIHVDAYNIDLDGVVDSVPPASGAAFAPLAPENATGNFTKIVQRLPVKIVISPDQPLANLLRMGFSVETTIYTGNAHIVGRQAKTSEAITDK